MATCWLGRSHRGGGWTHERPLISDVTGDTGHSGKCISQFESSAALVLLGVFLLVKCWWLLPEKDKLHRYVRSRGIWFNDYNNISNCSWAFLSGRTLFPFSSLRYQLLSLVSVLLMGRDVLTYWQKWLEPRPLCPHSWSAPLDQMNK